MKTSPREVNIHARIGLTIAATRLLKQARDALVLADAPRAAAKVRLALSSAQGAVRHARLRPYAEARRAPR